MKRVVALVIGAVIPVFLFVLSQYGHRLPTRADTEAGAIGGVLLLGALLGWFLPGELLALIAGTGVVVVLGSLATGPWFILAILFAAVLMAIAIAGWFVGRTLVRISGVEGHRLNDRLGVVVLGAALISPMIWLGWEGRHVVSGGFSYTPAPERDEGYLETTPAWTIGVGTRAFDGAPAAMEGRVFFTAGNFLYAIDSDGTVAWMLPGVMTQPLWHGGQLYAGMETGFARIDPHTGVIHWTAPMPIPASSDDSGENRRRLSAGASGTIYVNPGTGIHAIRPDGSIRWTFRHDAGNVIGAPVETSSGHVYVAVRRAGDSAVCAIDADGRLLWERRLPIPYVGSASLGADDTAYAAGSEYLVALTPDGRELWRRRFPRTVAGSTVSPTGQVLARGGGGGGGWYVMAADGRAIRVISDGGYPVFAGALMLMAGRDLTAFNAAGEFAYRVDIGSTSDFDRHETALGPDGMLYVQLRDRVVALPLPAPPYRFAGRR